MKAGIAVDDWKLPVFRTRLTEAGFAYTDGGELMFGVTLLSVVTDDLPALQKVIKQCQNECKKKGRP